MKKQKQGGGRWRVQSGTHSPDTGTGSSDNVNTALYRTKVFRTFPQKPNLAGLNSTHFPTTITTTCIIKHDKEAPAVAST